MDGEILTFETVVEAGAEKANCSIQAAEHYLKKMSSLEGEFRQRTTDSEDVIIELRPKRDTKNTGKNV